MIRLSPTLLLVLAALLYIAPAAAQNGHIGRPPTILLNAVIEGMPRGEKQQIRLLRGTLDPGQTTVFHTHPFPVTVYVLDGEFTLKIEDKTVTLKSGEAFSEPANVKITGYNRSATKRTSVVVCYVSNPNAPFLNPIR